MKVCCDLQAPFSSHLWFTSTGICFFREFCSGICKAPDHSKSWRTWQLRSCCPSLQSLRALSKGNKKCLPCKSSFKSSFKKICFFCSISLPSESYSLQGATQDRTLGKYILYFLNQKYLLPWLIHLEEVKVIWAFLLSITLWLALFATSCSLSAAGQSSPVVHKTSKRRAWSAGAEQPQHIDSSPSPPTSSCPFGTGGQSWSPWKAAMSGCH